jgi:hypothetical protein
LKDGDVISDTNRARRAVSLAPVEHMPPGGSIATKD